MLIFGSGDMATAINNRIGSTMIPEKKCDIRNIRSVKKVVEKYDPDVVMNCAGILEPENWKRTIDTNLTGAYNISEASKGRKMIFIASTAGLHGKKGDLCYCASKAGVISIVQSLASEGEYVFCISPARIDSSMRNKTHPYEDKSTRLDMNEIVDVVEDILKGEYESGDNIIVKKGWDIIVNKGEPWKKLFNLK